MELPRPRKRPSKTNSAAPGGKLKARDYKRELARLHVELVKVQQWVVDKRLKVCIVFEGRDGAGKGGAIKAITERVSPRIFRVIALSALTERETSQMYVQRYLPHLPAAGEIVIFDRSGGLARGPTGAGAIPEAASAVRLDGRFPAAARSLVRAAIA